MVKRTFYTIFLKRFFDIFLSCTAILFFSPLFILIILLEIIFHGFPIFFVQERIGKDEKKFKLIKFRSMNNKKDSKGELLPGDKRVTRFGRFLRRFSLDELPELFNIFVGQMSIIGPRPLLVCSLPFYSNRHRIRHLIKPGLALVSLKPIKTWTWSDQFENDVWYVENCSFLVDFKMLFAVAKEALRGSEYRVNDTREEFNGDNLFS